MGGQSTPLGRKLTGYVQIFRKHLSGGFGTPAIRVNHHGRLTRVFTHHVKRPVRGARMLEVGCGQLALSTALCAADGADITGIDLEVPTFRLSLEKFVRIIHTNGMERAVKSLLRHALFDGAYLRALQRESGRSLDFLNLDTRIKSVLDLDFPNNHFDFIFSDMVFEHIEDVPRAVGQINRVLKKDGVCWNSIHLYASLSGGHNLE